LILSGGCSSDTAKGNADMKRMIGVACGTVAWYSLAVGQFLTPICSGST
jgi:hypothetical protein